MQKSTNQKLMFVALMFMIVFGVTLLFSLRTTNDIAQNGRIRIVASFYPLTYIAEEVGGNLVAVSNLVPAGVEPHDFELAPRDFIEIGNADMLLFNGAALEPWIEKWRQGVFERPGHIVDMADQLHARGVGLIERVGGTDPHFWLDPLIMKSEVEIIRDQLSDIDPAHKNMFDNNAERLLNSLNSLDQNFRTGLSSCALRDVVVLHEAFNYPARQYHFNVTSIEGISPDEEPSPKDLARIVSLAREKGVKHIFFETVASPKFSELIAREVGGTTLVLNPIESLTPDEVQLGEDYVSLMEMNLFNLQKAMLCN